MGNKNSKLISDNLFSCPSCGKDVFTEKGMYEICIICGWEDDPIQSKRSDYVGGANKLSLNQYKEVYKKYHEKGQ